MVIFADQCQRLEVVVDSNRDGRISVTDVVEWLQFLYYLPTRFATLAIEKSTSLAKYFDINCDTGMHWGGAIFSGVVWLLIFGLISLAWGDSASRKRGGGRES
jgi:hypothetical protein